MTTRIVNVGATEEIAAAVRAAVEVLANGGVVAFPTETVYGVGARADLPIAMQRLRALKSRDADRAFTVHVGDREDVTEYVPSVPPLALRLIRKGWPGPLTLILAVEDPTAARIVKRHGADVAEALYYDNSVGLRCPDDTFALSLLAAVDAPVVAASANLAGNAPPWTAEAVLKDLDGKIDLLIDGGRTKYARPSTIVRVDRQGYQVVREGVLDAGSVERMTHIRLLFVCTGNTCRSPMAAGIARRLLAERLGCGENELAQRGVVVGSAGTSASAAPAAEHAIAVMRKRGVDITNHVATELTASTIQFADHIFAMTRAHRGRVLDLVPTAESRVTLLADKQDILDPVGSAEEEYERCARTIEAALRDRLAELDL